MFSKNSGRLINKTDLLKIESRSTRYESFFELHLDVAWFVHNCIIEYANDDDICNRARELPKFVGEEIESLKTCIECYNNAFQFPENSFSIPCAKPHPILWCQAPGWVYWPAKWMSVKNGMVHVRFFQDHTILNLPAESCYLFTDPKKIYPGEKLGSNVMFKAALKASYLNSSQL